tara:strand:- start:259 stop:513 length:255 start_codon:yes stop_codon:yes gene_type:complete
MCLFKIPSPKALPTPPPIKPMQDTNTALPDSKSLVDQDDAASIQYGTGQKKAGPAAGKKTGTDQLKIPLNTGGDPGSETGGMNV